MPALLPYCLAIFLVFGDICVFPLFPFPLLVRALEESVVGGSRVTFWGFVYLLLHNYPVFVGSLFKADRCVFLWLLFVVFVFLFCACSAEQRK